MIHEYKSIAFKMGNTDGLDTDCFQGYGAAFSNCDGTGDIIEQGAFRDTLSDFLSSGVIAWQHDWTEPIGKPLEAREDGYGLYLKARISQTNRGQDALTLLRDGVIGKMSIGYTVEGYKVLSDAEGRALMGESAYDQAVRDLPWWQDQIRVLTAIKLYEVSLVTVPANPKAVITGVKDGSLAGLTLDDHYQAVHAASRELITRVKGLADLRAKEGRVLSESNRAKLASMKDALGEHITTLQDLLVASQPASGTADPDADGKATDPPTETIIIAAADLARHELARFQRLQAQLNGAF